MGKRPSLIKAALDRLDGLMAIGESRFAAKVVAHRQDPSLWSFSTGRIHSYVTRDIYQQHVLAFLNWCRAEEGLRELPLIDARANELATGYLSMRLAQGQSAYTLQAVRSALRLFFGTRELAAEVRLPLRRREAITHSRGPAIRDADFQPANWASLIGFLQVTGLRRSEITVLRVRDVHLTIEGRAEVTVHTGKGGRPRTVLARPGQEEAVMGVIRNRLADERVFARIPSHLDVHASRRAFAQGLYQDLSGRPLPPAAGRLRRADYDLASVRIVSGMLGHDRADVVLRHYLR